MPATSVTEARTALLDALAARSGLAGVLVQLGLPTEIPDETERIYQLRVENGARARLTDQGGAAETYTLRLLIEVRNQVNGTWDDTSARAWEIFNLIDATIDDDPELDGTASDSMIEEFEEDPPLALTDGWLARITLGVAVAARI